MQFVDLGQMSFEEALARQEVVPGRIADGGLEETVHFVEHPHTFTIGPSGDAANLLAGQDWEGRPIDLVRTGRGGDITYHGPGQLVCYPHLDLRRRGRDVHLYLRRLEEALIGTASAFGIESYRRPGLTGVWTGEGKLASIGVGVRRWVTLHGFALNVATDLQYFQLIHPCGLSGCPVTSLSKLLERSVTLVEVRPIVQQQLVLAFGHRKESGIRSQESGRGEQRRAQSPRSGRRNREAGGIGRQEAGIRKMKTL